MEAKKKEAVETTTLSRVPAGEQKSWIDIANIQAGVIICVPSLMYGGMLAEGMDFVPAMIAGILGYGAAIIITTIMGLQGYDLGMPTCVISASSFGEKGSRILLSSLFSISLIGWFALQTNVCGAAFSNLMAPTFGISVPLWISTALWGIIMLITAVYGINALTKLNNLAVPALLLVSGYGMYLALHQFGTGALSATGTGTMSILTGAELGFSFCAVGTVIAADVTRYQRSRKDTVKSSFYGILPAGILMTLMGYVMSKVTGNYDISIVMADVGIPLLGMIVLVLATWTTNTTNSYSAGIDIVMLFNLKDDKRAWATLVAGAIGTVFAMGGAINHFQGFLFWVGYLFTPIAGIMIADYWILRKGDPSRWEMKPGIDWIAIVSWALGVLVTTRYPVWSPILSGMAASMVSFVVLKRTALKMAGPVPVEEQEDVVS